VGTIVTLINGATGTMTGTAVKLDTNRFKQGGSIPILISGITTATVSLEATIATDAEVNAGTAMWEQIMAAEWSADTCDDLIAAYTHIRGRVTAHTAGTIYMRILA